MHMKFNAAVCAAILAAAPCIAAPAFHENERRAVLGYAGRLFLLVREVGYVANVDAEQVNLVWANAKSHDGQPQDDPEALDIIKAKFVANNNVYSVSEIMYGMPDKAVRLNETLETNKQYRIFNYPKDVPTDMEGDDSCGETIRRKFPVTKDGRDKIKSVTLASPLDSDQPFYYYHLVSGQNVACGAQSRSLLGYDNEPNQPSTTAYQPGPSQTTSNYSPCKPNLTPSPTTYAEDPYQSDPNQAPDQSPVQVGDYSDPNAP